ncbi:hypothetical protein PM082_022783 [Marasmius tenuissimus]|nr:hypothetical protein PM082_022783 [Marasmius tenuissimus]
MTITFRKGNARRQARLSLFELKARDPQAFAFKKKVWRVFLQRRVSQRAYKQDARKYWDEVKAAQNRRIALAKEHSAWSESAMWELDERCIHNEVYCEKRLSTLESSLRRHFNDRPLDYFEDIYLQLVEWKSAYRPPSSPLDHPKVVLGSLEREFQSIRDCLWCNTGVSSVSTRATRLLGLTAYLQQCVSDFSLALSEEELIDDMIELGRLYYPLETKHNHGELKYQQGALVQRYGEVLQV